MALRTLHLSNIQVHRHQIQSVIRRRRRRYTRDAHTRIGLVSVSDTSKNWRLSDTDVLESSISTFPLLLRSRLYVVAYQAWVRPPDGFWGSGDDDALVLLISARHYYLPTCALGTLPAEHNVVIFLTCRPRAKFHSSRFVSLATPPRTRLSVRLPRADKCGGALDDGVIRTSETSSRSDLIKGTEIPGTLCRAPAGWLLRVKHSNNWFFLIPPSRRKGVRPRTHTCGRRRGTARSCMHGRLVCADCFALWQSAVKRAKK